MPVLIHIQRDQTVRVVRHRPDLDRRLEGTVPAPVENMERTGRVIGDGQVRITVVVEVSRYESAAVAVYDWHVLLCEPPFAVAQQQEDRDVVAVAGHRDVKVSVEIEVGGCASHRMR